MERTGSPRAAVRRKNIWAELQPADAHCSRQEVTLEFKDELAKLFGAEIDLGLITTPIEESIATMRRFAAHPETPNTVLKFLANHHSQSVVERVAENENASTETLMMLASHPSSGVRCALADNAGLSAEVIEVLVQDDCPDVRYRLAENYSLPRQIIETLAGDQNPYVANRAQQTLQRQSKKARVIGESGPWVKRNRKAASA